jgi:hypothetical protein
MNRRYPEGIEIIQPRVAAQPLPWVCGIIDDHLYSERVASTMAPDATLSG